MRFMLLTAAPANIIYSIEDFLGDVAIILCSRLTTHISTCTYNRLLKTVTELFGERLIGYTHRQTSILCYQIISHSTRIIKNNRSRLYRHGSINEIPCYLWHIAEITRHAVSRIYQADKRLRIVTFLYFINFLYRFRVGGVASYAPYGICRIEYHSTLSHALYSTLDVFFYSHNTIKLKIKNLLNLKNRH